MGSGTPILTEAEASSWLQSYGLAWEKGDADAIVALFTEDASYRETPFHAPMIGHDAIRQYWLTNPAMHQDVKFAFAIWTIVEDQCFAHWTSNFVKDDRKIELDGAFRLVFDRNPGNRALCHTLEEWWHKRSDQA